MSFILTDTTLAEAVVAVTASNGGLDTVYCQLVLAPFTPTNQTILSDLTLANLTGAPAVEVTWSDNQQGPASEAEVFSQLVTFQPTDASQLPVAAYGYCLFKNVGSQMVLHGAEAFDEPVNLNNVLNSCQLVLNFALPANSNDMGQATVVQGA